MLNKFLYNSKKKSYTNKGVLLNHHKATSNQGHTIPPSPTNVQEESQPLFGRGLQRILSHRCGNDGRSPTTTFFYNHVVSITCNIQIIILIYIFNFIIIILKY